MATRKVKPSVPSKSKFQSYIRYLWLAVIAGVLLFLATFVLVSFSKLPDTKELENPVYEYSSIIYSDDMKELGSYFEKNRIWVTPDGLSPHAVNALIATEDERFYTHSGIDAKGTLRAIAYLGKRGGASTITQQLAKLFFTRKSSNIVKRIWQKMQEWVIAIEFEKRYTKDEIIAMYLNKYDFLYDANGISAAAETYFGKNQRDLLIEEAAMLIGMLKNPRFYNPKLNPENADTRRMVVLHQMMKAKMISKPEYDSLKVIPLDLSNFKRKVHYDGPAPYFRSELKKWLKDLLNDPKYAKPGGGKYNIYTDGLKIHTTIDLEMQKHAEKAMVSHMKQVQERYFRVWKNRDPWTYDASSTQKRIRQNSLWQKVKQSDRYKRVRNKYLADISKEISTNIEGVRLWDADIERMLGEKKKSGHLNKLLRQDYISKKQKKSYTMIMESIYWDGLQEEWNAFQDGVKKEFNKKARMKVFSYSAGGERDTLMTPLDSIRYHNMHLQLGSLAVEPQTGHVKTWVGGINHKYFKYDHIHSNRQVGSTFKPLVYATAIFQLGMSPCWKVKDEQYIIPPKDPDFGLMNEWKPQNSRGTFSNDLVTLKEGLKQSLNSVSVYLVKEMRSVNGIRDLADNMGISKSKIPNAPSICLGAAELSVMDMTGAYAAIANKGIYTSPIFVTRIEDRNGRLIYTSVPDQRQALPENYNYVMLDMLKYASSSRHYMLESDFGGKTGTTNDYVDGWFMGVTPNLVVGTWVGGEDPWIRFLSLDQGQGGVMARPFFEKFMKKIEGDPKTNYDSKARFLPPEDELGIEIDCSKYEQQQEEMNDQKLPNGNTDEFEEEFEG
jgi:penicillin-binding protein 1A